MLQHMAHCPPEAPHSLVKALQGIPGVARVAGDLHIAAVCLLEAQPAAFLLAAMNTTVRTQSEQCHCFQAVTSDGQQDSRVKASSRPEHSVAITHPQELLLLPILYCLDPGGNDLVDSAGCFVVRAMTN